MVVIEAVDERSPAARLGLQKGDRLVSLNRQEINDVLDYEFYANDSGLRIEYLRGDERRAVSLWHRADEPLGLRFSTYLMDEKRRCRNSCIFCFIDQNPRGLRESLYFKDDDERLSFLHGNYITLTNLAPAQIERIVKMRISPINVSVHTTDPELRVRMMRNKDAGRVLGYLDTLAAGGIALNVQLVLCHTVNDGGALARSLDDLLRLDTLASVACVPAGLTAHRANLTPLTPFDRESACAVLDLLDEKAPAFYEKFGARTIYAADEFFLTAGRPLPDASYYEGYPQLENGVGMLRCHADEFATALAETAAAAPGTPFTCVTGEAAYGHICALVEAAKEKIPGLVGDVAKIRNDFYGPSITVAGLLVGRDIIAQLRARGHHGRLILPSCMLRAEGDLFLDDTTLPQLSEALGAAVTVAGPTGGELLRAMLADE